MIVVTGGAGFIGSNLVKGLNNLGHQDILVVDDLTDGKKFRNLVDCQISDYCDKADFLAQIQTGAPFARPIEVIFHQGACSDTLEWNGRFMLENNYHYSQQMLHYCQQQRIPFLYASSASVYGDGKAGFKESLTCEKPLNVYGYSKFLFDQYVRQILPQATAPIVGLRYFNVYGPREQHKGKMASVAWHFHQQLLAEKVVKLFAGSEGYADGEQRRDFVYVADAVALNLWFWQQGLSGIYNAGTGNSETFNAVAQAVIAWHGYGKIEYIPFPEQLRSAYQSFTQADVTVLRRAGYSNPFHTVAQGVKLYLDSL